MSVSCPRILPAGFIEPCIPTAARVPTTGPGWLHEIKHDGYRLVARLEGSRVRLFSRRGHMGGSTASLASVRPLASLKARTICPNNEPRQYRTDRAGCRDQGEEPGEPGDDTHGGQLLI